MFLNNKYSKVYWNIINSRKKINRTYDFKLHHRHHIIPTSLGGKDIEENKIVLTFKEHYICHLLLIEMVEGIERSKMIYAFFRFHDEKYSSAKSFELFMKNYSKNLKGENNFFYNKKHSKETKKKIGDATKNRKNYYEIWIDKYGEDEAKIRNEIMINKRSKSLLGENNPNFGKKHSEETINKMKNKRKGKKPSLGMKHSEETKKMFSIQRTGNNNPNFGKKRAWINNTVENKCILRDELEKYLKEGWVKGRK